MSCRTALRYICLTMEPVSEVACLSLCLDQWGAVTQGVLASIMRRGTDLATFLLRQGGEHHCVDPVTGRHPSR